MEANQLHQKGIQTYQQYAAIDKENTTRYLQPHICLNHLEKLSSITIKPELVRTLKSYYNTIDTSLAHSYSVFKSIPTTYVCTSDKFDNELNNFQRRYKELASKVFSRELMPSKHCLNNMWIVKPASLNQGRGIEIFSSANDIQKFILSKPLNSQWVIQKYIEKPLLFKKRKFDLRVWALVTDEGDVYLTIVVLLSAWIYAHIKR